MRSGEYGERNGHWFSSMYIEGSYVELISYLVTKNGKVLSFGSTGGEIVLIIWVYSVDLTCA
ncbi:hypothetical protein RchiOBHm_Chr2g0108111 [Rosa chinensis]|uniref:Uncharacterized protein n=1 Tax=Rosa chinensis TaxID=74649 RepID=A0A2P6RP68_ROSCH|nr:hypothetical protein RchiOBHm_Chr2g0108111 [Rosa chinensis]